MDRLERAFGRFAIANLSLYLVIGQVGVYLALRLGRLQPEWFVFIPFLAEAGEWWRLLTFILMPPPIGFLFIAFAWYMFYLMGSALEGYWGAFRYNLFLFLGYALTVGLAFLDPGAPVNNLFLAGSVFLAFAYLNPNFELALFLILPIRIKWLAGVAWIMYAIEFISGGWPARLQIVASVGNFLIFFGRDLWLTAGLETRRLTSRPSPTAAVTPAGPRARHRCRICGKTDKTNPELDFRYCSKCTGEQCYCPEHIFAHEHVTEPPHAP